MRNSDHNKLLCLYIHSLKVLKYRTLKELLCFCGFDSVSCLHAQFRENHEGLSSTEPPVCAGKHWCLRKLCSFLSSSCLFCSVSDLCRGHFNNYITSFKVFSQCVNAIVLCSSGTNREQIYCFFPQKSLLPLRLRDGRFHESVFFLFRLFYPAFLLAVTAECPGSGCNECLQKSDGLIPSSWTNASYSAGETELQLLVFHSNEKKGHSPKHKSRTIQKGVTLHLYVTVHCRGVPEVQYPPNPGFREAQFLCNVTVYFFGENWMWQI